MTTLYAIKSPVDVFQVLSVAEVCDEDGGIVQALDDGIHVACVS